MVTVYLDNGCTYSSYPYIISFQPSLFGRVLQFLMCCSGFWVSAGQRTGNRTNSHCRLLEKEKSERKFTLFISGYGTWKRHWWSYFRVPSRRLPCEQMLSLSYPRCIGETWVFFNPNLSLKKACECTIAITCNQNLLNCIVSVLSPFNILRKCLICRLFYYLGA